MNQKTDVWEIAQGLLETLTPVELADLMRILTASEPPTDDAGETLAALEQDSLYQSALGYAVGPGSVTYALATLLQLERKGQAQAQLGDKRGAFRELLAELLEIHTDPDCNTPSMIEWRLR